MKIFTVLFASTLMLLATENVSAQSKKKVIKEDQKIEFRNENGKKSLTIINNKNGIQTKEEYTGEEAQRKMEELNQGSHTSNARVFINEDDGESDSDKNIHVFSDEGEVSILHKDGKMIIKKIDKDGKEEIEEIDVDKMVDESLGNLQFKMEPHSFSFDFKNLSDIEGLDKQMEELGKKLEQMEKDFDNKMKTWSDNGTIIERFDNNGDNRTKIIVKEDAETLTPSEIKEKYGVDVTGEGDEQIVIKKVITVKKDGAKEKVTDSPGELTKPGDANVFPNPGTGQFTLNYNASKGGKTTLEVKDSKGAIVYTSEFASKGIVTRDIDLKHLPAGSYTMSIRNGGTLTTKNLIIE